LKEEEGSTRLLTSITGRVEVVDALVKRLSSLRPVMMRDCLQPLLPIIAATQEQVYDIMGPTTSKKSKKIPGGGGKEAREMVSGKPTRSTQRLGN